MHVLEYRVVSYGYACVLVHARARARMIDAKCRVCVPHSFDRPGIRVVLRVLQEVSR